MSHLLLRADQSEYFDKDRDTFVRQSAVFVLPWSEDDRGRLIAQRQVYLDACARAEAIGLPMPQRMSFPAPPSLCKLGNELAHAFGTEGYATSTVVVLAPLHVPLVPLPVDDSTELSFAGDDPGSVWLQATCYLTDFDGPAYLFEMCWDAFLEASALSAPVAVEALALTHEQRAAAQLHTDFMVRNVDLGLLLRQRDIVQKARDGHALSAEEQEELEGAINMYDALIDGAEDWPK